MQDPQAYAASRKEAETALSKARRAAKRGDRVEADRWSKTADRLAAAAERVAALPPAEEEDVEEIRAELRRRIARACDAAHQRQLWEEKMMLYNLHLKLALQHNFAPPGNHPGPCPVSDDDVAQISAGRHRDLDALRAWRAEQLAPPEDAPASPESRWTHSSGA